ncbi:MAG TPA: DUF2239 family protein [Hyphomonadaceae bacterium]|jgi:hypothetical protein|nr:DUF2239 family protein [Hyphomonadaceae bacterium]
MTPAYIAYEGSKRLAAGDLPDVAAAVRKRALQPSFQAGGFAILTFNYATGQRVDVDIRGAEKDVRARYADKPAPAPVEEDVSTSAEKRGPGRPKLGVVPREVTLLPRHWEWLNAQPGGASVALRRLVDDARKARGRTDVARSRQEAAYRFMSSMAGNWKNYEEALRALFAADAARFAALTESWPIDVRDHARHLAALSPKAAEKA